MNISKRWTWASSENVIWVHYTASSENVVLEAMFTIQQKRKKKLNRLQMYSWHFDQSMLVFFFTSEGNLSYYIHKKYKVSTISDTNILMAGKLDTISWHWRDLVSLGKIDEFCYSVFNQHEPLICLDLMVKNREIVGTLQIGYPYIQASSQDKL
jgi:hypothetical protein